MAHSVKDTREKGLGLKSIKAFCFIIQLCFLHSEVMAACKGIHFCSAVCHVPSSLSSILQCPPEDGPRHHQGPSNAR